MGTAGHIVVLRYHEIALKGRNRPFFVRRLVENVERATTGLPVGRVRRASARLLLPLADAAAWPVVRDRLARVFGIVNFALAHEHRLATRGGDAAAEVACLGEAIVARLAAVVPPSFRVRTKRSDKRFALTSPEVNALLGRMIQAATGAPVDLDAAALTVAVDILPGRAFFSLEKVPGAGGLPVGTSGRVLVLLSGGIDSPVAAWRMLRRGCRVDLVHFHSVPFLDRTSQEKARELARLLAAWALDVDLYLVPFGEVQRQIVAAVGRPLRVVLYRRMMLRIAEALARRAGGEALVTGDSLGQVASQTLANLAVIGEAAELPVLRPLVGMDKSEIAAEAARIGTFETSIIPDQDCCTLFTPRHPATRAERNAVRALEARLEVAALVAQAVGATERMRLRVPREHDEQRAHRGAPEARVQPLA
ncbi:MAG TPA: tRNA uracil 4-sulfurtransferase ThiI [Candidatus Limnocylindria bacterium]|jgi:thiamine biosynthesis protein ThiI|nr:tRNA uracil 4-sulfurtransferase ThiI [Candidatus Limnocylindria bacterium]